MKKNLKRRTDRMQRSMQLYDCICSGCTGCSGCSGTPSSNYNENVAAKTASKGAHNIYNNIP